MEELGRDRDREREREKEREEERRRERECVCVCVERSIRENCDGGGCGFMTGMMGADRLGFSH